jgi:hypothetical protein
MQFATRTIKKPMKSGACVNENARQIQASQKLKIIPTDYQYHEPYHEAHVDT